MAIIYFYDDRISYMDKTFLICITWSGAKVSHDFVLREKVQIRTREPWLLEIGKLIFCTVNTYIHKFDLLVA